MTVTCRRSPPASGLLEGLGGITGAVEAADGDTVVPQ